MRLRSFHIWNELKKRSCVALDLRLAVLRITVSEIEGSRKAEVGVRATVPCFESPSWYRPEQRPYCPAVGVGTLLYQRELTRTDRKGQLGR